MKATTTRQTTIETPAPAAPVASARIRVRQPRAIEMKPPPAAADPVVKANAAIVIPEDWLQHAITYFEDNKLTNAAKGRADKARKTLYAEMKKAGVATFDFEAVLSSGEHVNLVANLEEPPMQWIDTKALLAIVGQEKFMEIVEASRKSVDDHCAGNVAIQCLRSGTGTENVKVRLSGE